MTAIVQAGANQPLSFTVGDDVSLRLTVTENSVAYSWTGATVTTSIIANGAAVATNFTTATSAGGILDLSLTDTETTTLGLGTFDYWVKVTKASVTSTWVAGQLTMHAAQYGAASSLSSSLSITTAASTTLAITLAGGTTADHVTASGMTGGTDVSTALSAFWAAAQAQSMALYIPRAANGLPYKVSSILSPWNGARITSNGATLDFQTDHSATGRGIHIGSAVSVTPVSDVRITGLNVISSNSTSRLGVYGLISIFNSSNVIIQDCYLGSSTAKYGGEATGIFVMNSNTLTIRNVVVENTLADGIHISRGSYNVIIDNPIVINSQDDAIAVVSVKQDGAGPIYAACKDIQIRNPVVKSTTVLGSGIALAGAQRITIVGGTIDSVVARGLTITAYDQGGIIYPSLITVTGLIITNVGAAETAITVASADRVTFHALNISSVFGGINVLGCTRTTISGCDISTTGAPSAGVYDNSASSRTNVSGCNLSGNLGGAFLLQGTGSISTGANIVA